MIPPSPQPDIARALAAKQFQKRIELLNVTTQLMAAILSNSVQQDPVAIDEVIELASLVIKQVDAKLIADSKEPKT